jgi:peptide/nickel transport system substrate-binding protein
MSSSPRQRRKLGRAIVAGAAAAFVIALGATPAAADPSPSGSSSGLKTFTIGTTQDMDSINPFSGYLSISYEVYGDVYDLLLGWSQKDFSPVPGLATSWSHTPDGLTWTYKIRSGVNWSDGVPMTASDVAFTFNRAIDDPNGTYSNYVKNIKHVDAPDATTAVFTMTAPDPIMTQLWVPILPEHIWSKVKLDDNGTFDNAAMVGTGAFQFVKWDKGQDIVLKANKNYWGGPAKIDQLVYKVYSDEDAMIQALLKGDIDAVDGVTANAYISLANHAGITRINAPGSSFTELGFNSGAATVDNQPVGNGAPAARDPKFRQAIGYAIDLKALSTKVMQGYGQIGQSIIPPNYSAFSFNAGSNAYTYDKAKAEQMLDAAGYTKDSSGYRIDPATHKELNLRFDAPNDDPNTKSSVQQIAGWLADVGIKTKTDLVQEDKLTDLVAHGEVDIYVWGWGVEPDPSFQLSTMTCDQRDTGTPSDPTSGWSDSFYCNPQYDALFKQQGETLDPAAREAIVKQMQQILYTDAPYIVLYYSNDLEAYNSNKWTGIQLQPESTGNAFFQYGTYTYRSVDLKTNAKKSGSGLNTAVLVGAGAIVVVALIGGVVVGRRRGRTADERE